MPRIEAARHPSSSSARVRGRWSRPGRGRGTRRRPARRPTEPGASHVAADDRQRHVVRAERLARRDGEHEVHRLADLEPRRADGRREQAHLRSLRHGVRVAGVVELVVDEHAHVVDDRDRLVDHGVRAAEELEPERVEVDGVARVHRDHVVARGGLDDTLGAVDRHARERLAEPVEVIGRPVVGVLVGDDDADDARRGRSRGAVNDPGSMTSVLPASVRVRVACSNLVTRMPRVNPSGVRPASVRADPASIWPDAVEHGIIERLRKRPHRIAA